MKQTFLFDTDIGTDIDDLLALMLLTQLTKNDNVAVVATNGPVSTRAKVALTLIEKLGLHIPVFRGKANSLSKVKPFIHGKENDGVDTTRSSKSLRDLEYWLLGKRDRSVIIISTAPLTTAAWVVLNKKISIKIQNIFLMGGTIQDKHVPSTEHNFASDPKSTNVVLNSNIPKFLICLNLSLKHKFSIGEIRKLQNNESSIGKILSMGINNWFNTSKKFTGEDAVFKNNIFLHDPLTVLAAIKRQDFLWKTKTISVDTFGNITENPQGNRIQIAEKVRNTSINLIKRLIIASFRNKAVML